MNASKAIEYAVAATVRKYAAIGPETVVRAWQSIGADGAWDQDKDRDFPVIEVRCSSPSELLPERTRYVEVAILCATKTQDDKDHRVISALYGEAERVAMALYDQVCDDPTAAEYAHFAAVLAGEGNTTSIGGITLGDGMSPTDDAGVNMMGITLRIDYARL